MNRIGIIAKKNKPEPSHCWGFSRNGCGRRRSKSILRKRWETPQPNSFTTLLEAYQEEEIPTDIEMIVVLGEMERFSASPARYGIRIYPSLRQSGRARLFDRNYFGRIVSCFGESPPNDLKSMRGKS